MRLLTAIWVAVISLDRLTKIVAGAFLLHGTPVRLLPFLHLTLVHNEGAAFGMLPGMRWVLVATNAVVGFGVFVLGRYLDGEGRLPFVALGLIGGGAVGNLIDRAWRGYVVDFLDLEVWPVFNIADMAIVSGGILLGWYLLGSLRAKPGMDRT